MARSLVLAITIGIAAASPAMAQGHGEGEANRCQTCHTSHNPEAGPWLLGPIPPSAEASAASSGLLASGLSRPSLSCLGCHGTPDTGSGSPGLTGRSGLPTASGVYLGPDLSDDHPLARSGGDRGTTREARGLRIQPLRTGGASESRPPPTTELMVLPECTACHDVHAPGVGTVRKEDERAVCTTCHDPTAYSMQEHSGLACTACHDLHGGTDVYLLAEPSPELLCLSCHALGAASPGSDPVGGQSAHLDQPDLATGRCQECHRAHR